jgi:hypothetical protein
MIQIIFRDFMYIIFAVPSCFPFNLLFRWKIVTMYSQLKELRFIHCSKSKFKSKFIYKLKALNTTKTQASPLFYVQSTWFDHFWWFNLQCILLNSDNLKRNCMSEWNCLTNVPELQGLPPLHCRHPRFRFLRSNHRHKKSRLRRQRHLHFKNAKFEFKSKFDHTVV